MRVVVAHPGRQHSHQLAMALADENMLLQYITGVPTHPRAGWAIFHPFLRHLAGRYDIPLSPTLVHHAFISPIARKTVCRLALKRHAVALAHRADGWFDTHVAQRLAKLRPDVVIGYENACLKTFQRAKQMNIRTVLDAAALHHTWQDRFHKPVTSPRAHQHILARKDAEIELADNILTVSDYARTSYVEAGVPSSRVHTIPMGVALERFPVCGRRLGPDRPVRFVFVGSISEHKGADVLRDCVRILTARNVSFDLTVFGRHTSQVRLDDLPNVHCRGWVCHDRLAVELQSQDVLVLPSRHDSFGMVVAEAMACGLPAIVSDHVGAKQMVTPEVNGLVVPAGDSIALAAALEWFVANRDRLRGMIPTARQTAQQYSWEAYRRRIVDQLRRYGRR